MPAVNAALAGAMPRCRFIVKLANADCAFAIPAVNLLSFQPISA